MKKVYTLIILLALIILGGGMGLWYYHQQTADTNTLKNLEHAPGHGQRSQQNKEKNRDISTSSVSIEAEYENKIVYTTEQSAHIEALKKDCKDRGGEFNECGSVCGPEADTCATVCAYTCELESSGDRSDLPGEWQTYTNQESGFSMDYSSALKKEEGSQEIVKFTLLGPTQREGTEIFDGISVIVTTATHTQKDLKNYIESRLEKTGEIGEVTSGPKRVVLNGNNGYRYEKVTAGSSTVLTFPLSEEKVIKISYSAPDPEDRGYREIVEEMINSFRILDQNKDKMSTNLYYVHSDSSEVCTSSAVAPVTREIERGTTPIQDTVKLLLQGDLKPSEIQQGFSTEFSEAKNFTLKGAGLKDGSLTLEFSDPDNFTSGGSCRVNLLKAQIKQTALQFFPVKEVELRPNTLFQP